MAGEEAGGAMAAAVVGDGMGWGISSLLRQQQRHFWGTRRGIWMWEGVRQRVVINRGSR
jgi:hypothetical protein